MNNSQEFPSFNRDAFPKSIELQASAEVVRWLRVASAASGRCQGEIMLELLDRSIKSF